MARNPLPPSSNPSDDSDSDEELVNESDAEEEHQPADALIQNNDDVDEEEDDELDNEDEEEPDKETEPMEEEESLEKIASPARGLDYGSDTDSPLPSPSDYILKENSDVKKKNKKKKRSAESEPVKANHEAKKSKKEVNGGERAVVSEEKVKKLIWKPEDELKIVNGMLEYKNESGIDYNSNMDSFYKYIKGMLNVAVDKSQLVNKIRKLKEKFRDIAVKEADGEELVLKSHEEEMYEVSKSVWGEQGVGRSNGKGKKEKSVSTDAPAVEVKTKSKKDKSMSKDVPVVESKSKTAKSVSTDVPQVEESRIKKEKNVETDMHMLEVDSVLALPVPDTEISKKEVNGGSVKTASKVRKSVKKPKVVTPVEFYEADSDVKGPVISMPALDNDFVFERGSELVEKSKLDALNEKWTRYQIEAAELYLKKLDLIKERTKLFLDAMKSISR